MVFRAFPDGPDPLRLKSAEPGSFVPFLEMIDPDTQLMFLRIVASDDSCSPTTSAPPRIRLIADDGPKVAVLKAPNSAEVFNDVNDLVGAASWSGEEAGVFLVLITVKRLGSIWQVEITNANSEPRSFTWTVASCDDDARQPWIDLPPVDFGSVSHPHTATHEVRMINRGSKTLMVTIDETLGRVGQFRLSSAQDSVIAIAPHECDSFNMTFETTGMFIHPQGTSVESSLPVKSNATNNRSVRLMARATQQQTGGTGEGGTPIDPTNPPQ